MLLFSYLNDHQTRPKGPKTHTKAQTWSQMLTTSFPLAFLMQPLNLQKWHQLCCPDSIKANYSNWAPKSPALVSFREPPFQWLNYASFIRKWQSVKQKLTTQRASCYAATWNSKECSSRKASLQTVNRKIQYFVWSSEVDTPRTLKP